jgi:hypothetical protein
VVRLTKGWPPEDGREFIRSNAFGEMLLELASTLAAREKSLDFSDAVAQVFVWFDRTLSRNRRFINERRFPSRDSFKAYLKQALYNAGLLAERRRRREGFIEELSDDLPIASTAMGPEQRVEFLDLLDSLPEPHKTIFYRLAFENEDPALVASIHDLSEEEVYRLYEEAVDMVAKHRAP